MNMDDRSRISSAEPTLSAVRLTYLSCCRIFAFRGLHKRMKICCTNFHSAIWPPTEAVLPPQSDLRLQYLCNSFRRVPIPKRRNYSFANLPVQNFHHFFFTIIYYFPSLFHPKFFQNSQFVPFFLKICFTAQTACWLIIKLESVA